MSIDWRAGAVRFLQSMRDPVSGGSRSVTGGPVTLYGTCYESLGGFYLGANGGLPDERRRFIVERQDPQTGFMIGPELRDFEAPPGAIHDREHLLMHLTCAAVPTCQHFGIQLKFPIAAAHRFCDLDYLGQWTDRRDLKKAWFEGNNILFVGQLLVYLRDVERYSGAQAALDRWFDWLQTHVDLTTGLWGTDGHCSALEAVCGGYQLLVYYHEERRLINPEGIIDTVLGLQHLDGGFNPWGNAGACEDVDSVGILVNLYKRFDYRREDIRFGLKRCLGRILSIQNPDGGFAYNLNYAQSHMGIPGTQTPANVSTTFSTWFRIHTLALIDEILPEERAFSGIKLRFSSSLSMGWHQSPPGWFLHVRARERLSSAKPRLRYYGGRGRNRRS
jgi:Prenyltransferase and squalene oxidase repeat